MREFMSLESACATYETPRKTYPISTEGPGATIGFIDKTGIYT